jgi:hypothetical protein
MPTEEIFIGRQPILDRGQQLVAYELLFRSGSKHNSIKITNLRHASSKRRAARVYHGTILGIGAGCGWRRVPRLLGPARRKRCVFTLNLRRPRAAGREFRQQ